MPYWSANIRLEQNIATWNSICQNEREAERFLAFFGPGGASRLYSKQWRMHPNLPTAVRMGRKEVIAAAYRLYPHNFTSWPMLQGHMREKQASEREILSAVQHVQLDFLRMAYTPGSTFSHWRCDHATNVLQQPLTDLVVFECISIDLERKKLVHKLSPMRFPMYVQWYEVMLGSVPDTYLQVKPCGYPELVDGFTLVPWTVASRTLLHWKTKESMDGTVYTVLREPVIASKVDFEVTDPNVSAYRLLAALRAGGWKSGTLEQHTRGSEKLVVMDGVTQRKNYLRVLLQLPTLFERIEHISVLQHDLYYYCLLHLQDISQVKPRLRVKDYKQLLEHASVGCPLSVAAEIVVATEQEDFEIEGMAADDEDDEVEAAPEGEDPTLPEEQHAEDVEEDTHAARQSLSALGYPEMVEGERLYLDFNMRENYARVCVQCPLRSSEHNHRLACKKYRGISDSQKVNFGDKEPIAYLGVWIRHARQSTTRETHVKYNPPLNLVRDYAREHGWMA
eukprot:6490282-Amphidinium_carterae.1